MSTPDRDLVEELRQRARRANTARCETASEHDQPDDYLDLGQALFDLIQAITGRRPGDPVVLATVRELIGQGVTYTEWCVYWDSEDPNACSFMPTRDGVGELLTYDELDEARQMRRIILDGGRHVGGIAQRQVTVCRSPWQVVGTEVGEPQ